MKTVIFLVLLGFALSLDSCRKPPPPDAVFVMPYFNQVNTDFNETEIQCLLDQWYAMTYKEEPIILRVINDAGTYNSFFACKDGVDLQPIDFSQNTLLVGMKADYASLTNTPVKIHKMEQKLTQAANGDYLLQVTVTGREGSGDTKGGEWFAFTSLVPKIQGKVNLEMKYQFER